MNRYIVETAPQFGEWQLVDTLNESVIHKSFNRQKLEDMAVELEDKAARRAKP